MIESDFFVPELSSFRDRSGFIFMQDGCLYRQVNQSYSTEYEQLITSGLYEALVGSGLLISHREVEDIECEFEGYKILRPEFIPLITYPYEWCFSQYRDAALLTLKIQKIALQHGMTLKDASAYNVQFLHGKPVFIDTLSFEPYEEGKPWVAYSQFCQHFLAPIALIYYSDFRLVQLTRAFIDGIPLDLASSLLPGKTRLSFGLLTHIHLHAKSKSRYGSENTRSLKSSRGVSKNALFGILDSLESVIRGLQWCYKDTEWADYYNNTNYNDESFHQKSKLLKDLIGKISPEVVWDLGANTGYFSRVIAQSGAQVVAFDIDPNAIERNYELVKEQGERHILPLFLDVNSPSPAIGWANEERMSLAQRSNADVVVALALIHHLAISNNVPLERVAKYFATLAPNLIIEFVPKEDSQVQRLLESRKDIFEDYHCCGFECAFSKYYEIMDSHLIDGTMRRLYRMVRRQNKNSGCYENTCNSY